MKKILVINPGSTSTKFAVYHDEDRVFKHTLTHSPEELAPFHNIFEQEGWRRDLIIDCLKENGIPLEFDAVMGRGGLAQPVEGGTYEVDPYMIRITRAAEHHHACDLGCLLAHDIAQRCGVKSYIADPGVTDERCESARINGSPLMPPYPIWHALNQKAIARRFAKDQGTSYDDLNLIICHMGGGISVSAHEKGRTIDVGNALDGSGPFSPERAGTLPAGDLIHHCFSGKYTENEMMQMVRGRGGLVAHLGTSDALDVERRAIAGEEPARRVYDAMIYHVAKEIAAQSAPLCGKVDAVIITGGMAHSDYIVERLRKYVSHIAPVYVYPGEDELLALAQNGLAVLRGEMEPKFYPQEQLEHVEA